MFQLYSGPSFCQFRAELLLVATPGDNIFGNASRLWALTRCFCSVVPPELGRVGEEEKHAVGLLHAERLEPLPIHVHCLAEPVEIDDPCRRPLV